MREFGWTIAEVDSQPYEKLMKLIINTKKKEQKDEVVGGADFIKNL